MKKLITITGLLLIIINARAQDYSFPIGKTKSEIRKGNRHIPLVFEAEGDSVESYYASNQRLVYYYKDSICRRVIEIFMLDYENDVRAAFDKFYKKVKDNVWLDSDNNEIDLTEDRIKGQFSFVVYRPTTN